jgi:hypothetical protein
VFLKTEKERSYTRDIRVHSNEERRDEKRIEEWNYLGRSNEL